MRQTRRSIKFLVSRPFGAEDSTKYGITIHDYRRYVKPNATAADVRAMTIEEAKAIYRKRSWDALRCDNLPAGIDYAVFDYGVNSGIGRSGKVLRRVLGLHEDMHTINATVLGALVYVLFLRPALERRGLVRPLPSDLTSWRDRIADAVRNSATIAWGWLCVFFGAA